MGCTAHRLNMRFSLKDTPTLGSSMHRCQRGISCSHQPLFDCCHCLLRIFVNKNVSSCSTCFRNTVCMPHSIGVDSSLHHSIAKRHNWSTCCFAGCNGLLPFFYCCLPRKRHCSTPNGFLELGTRRYWMQYRPRRRVSLFAGKHWNRTGSPERLAYFFSASLIQGCWRREVWSHVQLQVVLHHGGSRRRDCG